MNASEGTPILRIPQPVEKISEVWPSEPHHFTPWLADHLEVLDFLGLGQLSVSGTEVNVPGTLRALDILATRPTGENVAIENQYGRLDHDHLTRGLAYAVGLQAPDLVVVAEAHLSEFRAVARYLNEVAERSEASTRIRVHLVEVSVERVEQYYIPRFSVVEAPNPWTEAAGDVAHGTKFASLEEFIQAADPSARDRIRSVAVWWLDHAGSMRYGAKQAISLDRQHPSKPGPVSAVVVWLNGTYTVNRGYLIESGSVPVERTDQFDEYVQRELPDLKWTGKHYYLASSAMPTIEELAALVRWLEGANDSGISNHNELEVDQSNAPYR